MYKCMFLHNHMSTHLYLPFQSKSRASCYPFFLLCVYDLHIHSEKPSSNYSQYIYIIAQSLNTQKVVSEFLTMSL